MATQGIVAATEVRAEVLDIGTEVLDRSESRTEVLDIKDFKIMA